MAVSGTGDAASGTTKLVCFYLGGQEYGAPITEVKETMLLRPITSVFLTPPWLAGIINLRGDVVAVIDLAQLLGQAPTRTGLESRIVIAQHQREDGVVVTAGVLVDRMAELRNVDLDGAQPPPTNLAPDSAALLHGVLTVEDDAPLRVLDLPALFESDRLRAFQRQA